jgi:hypothetical protein
LIVESSVGDAFVFYGCSGEESVRPELFAVSEDQGGRGGVEILYLSVIYRGSMTMCAL